MFHFARKVKSFYLLPLYLVIHFLHYLNCIFQFAIFDLFCNGKFDLLKFD